MSDSHALPDLRARLEAARARVGESTPTVELSALIAVGGNSHFARSMRAKMQWRDRHGRWIEMGRGVKFKFRRHDGSVVSANGVFVGATDKPNVGQLYVSKDPNGLKDGFYNIDSANAQEILASLDAGYLQQRGIELGKHADGSTVGERLSEDIPDQAAIPFSDAPTGWKAVKNGDTIMNWVTDDGEFKVERAPFQLEQKTGKKFILYQNGKSVGAAKDWAEALSKVNEIDANPNNPNNKNEPLFPGDPQDAKNQAKADLADKQAGFGPENPDIKARAKRAIAEYDPQGTVAKLIDQGAPSKDVLNALDNNANWKAKYQSYFRRGDVDLPTKHDKQGWDDTAKRVDAIKGLDTEVPIDVVDRNTGHNLDLSVGDVAADGYLVPTQGNNETHNRQEFDGENAVQALADYVNKHKSQLEGGGKRLSVTFDNENQKVVFDIVDQVPDHNEAQQMASERGVTDIYDVKNSKVISSEPSRDPNATGIGDNSGADQPNGNNADANSGAQQSEQPHAGADHPVADAAGQGNAPEEHHGPDSGADHASPAGGEPAHSAPSGEAKPAEHAPAEQQHAEATAKPAEQPADNSGQPSEAPAERPVAEAHPEVAPLPQAAPEIVNPKDNLPDDPAQLQRMAMRLEARAALLQDSPAAHAIADTLDAIYAKLNGEAPEDSSVKPVSEQGGTSSKAVPNVQGNKESSGGPAPEKTATPDTKGTDAAPKPDATPAPENAPSPKTDNTPAPEQKPAPAQNAAPADAASKADVADLHSRIDAIRQQIQDGAAKAATSAPAQPVEKTPEAPAPQQVDTNMPDAPSFAKGDPVQWTDRAGRKRTGKIIEPNKRAGWFNVALDNPKKNEADRYAFDGERLSKLDEPKADAPAPKNTPTQAEPANNNAPEVPSAPEQASEPTPAPAAPKEQTPAPEAKAPEAPQPAQPQAPEAPANSIEQELADAQAAVRVAQRRLDAAQAAGKDPAPYQEDLQYAQEDLRGLQRIAQRRAEREQAPQDNAPQAPEAPQAPVENAPEAPQANVPAENAPADVPAQENAPAGNVEAPAAPEANTPEQQVEQIADQQAANELADPQTPDDQALAEFAREQADPNTPSQNPPVELTPRENDLGDTGFQNDLGFLKGLIEENGNNGFDAVFNPDDPNRAKAVFDTKQDAQDWLGDKIAQEAGSNVNSITGAPVGQGRAPKREWQGEPAFPYIDGGLNTLLNVMEGKDLNPEDAARIKRTLFKPGLTKGELADLKKEINEAPNVAGGASKPRDKASNPVNFTNASEDLLKVQDANQIVDPNLIMADLKRNHPGHRVLPNGDVVVETRTVGNKTYDVIVRRTRRERFLTYVRETNLDTGEVRASRIGNETHSYMALRTKMNQAKHLIRQDNVERRFRQRKNIENLPQGVDAGIQNGIVQDLIDHVNGPRTADGAQEAKADILKEVISAGGGGHVLDAKPDGISNARADEMVHEIAKKDGNDQAVKIIGSDGKEIPSHIPYGGGDSLKVGDWVDWTDTRQTVNGEVNPDYGKVFRGQVRQLRYKTNDGKYVYSDSTYVVFPELNARAGHKPSKQRARISSTLKKVDGQFAEPSEPFFPKAVEKHQQENVVPGKTPADFGVPKVDGGLQPRPNVPQVKDIEPNIDINGNAWVGSADNPVAVPMDNAALAQEARGQNGGMFPANRVAPGDYIQIKRPDDGMQVYAKVSRVTPGENGQVGIEHVHFDRNGQLRQSTLTMRQNGLIMAWRGKQNGPAPLVQAQAPEPEVPHFGPQKYNKGDIVFVQDIPGNRGEVVSISAPNKQGERTYVIRADQNGMEYSRQERYVDGNQTGDLAMQAATIQPVEKQNNVAWRKDPASEKQKSFIRALADKKQLSPASKKQVNKALADSKLTKGQASDLINELQNHKPRAERVNKVAEDAALDKWMNDLAKGLGMDPNAPANGLDVKHATDAAEQAKQALEGENGDIYGGEKVRKMPYSALSTTGNRPAFAAIQGVDPQRLKAGDVLMDGVGDNTRYFQVLTDPSRWDRAVRVREIADPKDEVWGWRNGTVTTMNMGHSRKNILRPTGYAPKDYFKKGFAGNVEADNFFKPHAEGTVPVVIQDYNARAADLLAQYNDGWKPTRAINEGAINQGANFLELANGREVFQKAVGDEREYWNEILASKVLNAIGVNDIVVVGLPDGKNLIQDKVDGKMAKEDWDARAKIMADPAAHPNFRLIGLLDYLFQNTDRHDGNWMINKDGQPVPIDHGYTWFGKARMGASATFARAALGRLAGMGRGDGMFTKSELVALRENIKSLRAEFVSAGHLEWYNYVLRRITTLINNY